MEIMDDKPKSIWKKSRTARTLFALACLITLDALFYAEENWRGWHAWQKFKQEWEAKGERFDFASVVPPPVPDEQNFAMTPIVASCYSGMLDRNGHELKSRNTNVVDRVKMSAAHNDNWPTNSTGNWQKSTMSDLSVWQNYYRALAVKTNEFPVPPQPQSPAADVLLALSRFDSTIAVLRQASKLPASRFPLEYDKGDPSSILVPHLASLKSSVQMLQLRTIAELQNGQSKLALADMELSLRLVDSIRTEPFLLSHLVRIAMLQLLLQPVYEGLAEHRWSEEQLVELDVELVKLDFLTDYRLSMRGEFTHHDITIEYYHQHPEQLVDHSGDDDNNHVMSFPVRIAWRLRLIPTGWFYQNRLRCARMVVEFYIPLADVNRGAFSPALARRGDAVLSAETKTFSPFNVVERMLLPGLDNTVKKFACAQASVDLARVAIALERYRLAHGDFPESLDVLAPQFIAKLPHDVINGQPLHYRRTSDGQFLLYSVGWNETDDGGEVGRIKYGAPNISEGDWVWRYPAK
jgi:hypothetical protein